MKMRILIKRHRTCLVAAFIRVEPNARERSTGTSSVFERILRVDVTAIL